MYLCTVLSFSCITFAQLQFSPMQFVVACFIAAFSTPAAFLTERLRFFAAVFKVNLHIFVFIFFGSLLRLNFVALQLCRQQVLHIDSQSYGSILPRLTC